MVSIEEIREIWDCNESKASRPDERICCTLMLGGVIDFLVNDTQTTFIRGRQILNGFLLANEVVDSMKKRRCNDGGCVLKMAYGSL
ncbi:hypothetical protein ERO13_D02G166350v2 [Gossypium hirsutum]|nr:hypothetical protein ERO13_D02G166350v2 [Gossypium hirsutum]